MIRDPQNEESSSSLSDAGTFRIVAIYDSARASAEAARASAVVLRELGDDVDVDRSSWDLKALHTPQVCDFAADEAARADVIVIALSKAEASESLKQWVAQWEAKRTLPGGLLALIPSGERTRDGDLENYLSEAALSAQMDFVCRQPSRLTAQARR